MCVCVCVQYTKCSLHANALFYYFNRFHTCIVDVITSIHYKYGQYYVKHVHEYHP